MSKDNIPKVSVIVPVYNSSKYLNTCLNSLLSQTLDNIEIIIINDNSLDNSLDILKSYKDLYPNLNIYNLSHNIGQGNVRNLGIKLSHGEYIGFVDSDDYIHPDMYKTMYESALKYNYPDIITTGLIFVEDNYYATNDLSFMNRTTHGKIINPKENPAFILNESPSVCNKLFRKDIIKNYEFLPHCLWEDIAFSYTKLMGSSRILKLDANIDYFYRRNINNGSVSSTNYQYNPHIIDIFKVADELEIATQSSGAYPYFKDQIKLLQLAICLERVTELNKWPLPQSELSTCKHNFYQEIFSRYGNLGNINLTNLQLIVPIQTIEDYSKFLNNKSKPVTRIKVRYSSSFPGNCK